MNCCNYKNIHSFSMYVRILLVQYSQEALKSRILDHTYHSRTGFEPLVFLNSLDLSPLRLLLLL